MKIAARHGNRTTYVTPRNIGHWSHEALVSRLYFGFSMFTFIFLTIAYLAYLPYSSDFVGWTLMIIPIDISTTILMLAVAMKYKSRRADSYWRGFAISFRDALSLIDTAIAGSGMSITPEMTKYNWLLLSKPKAAFRIEKFEASVEVYGSEMPECAVYVRGFTTQNETVLTTLLLALDEAGKPAALPQP